MPEEPFDPLQFCLELLSFVLNQHPFSHLIEHGEPHGNVEPVQNVRALGTVTFPQIANRVSPIREKCDRLVHLQALRLEDFKQSSPRFGVVARNQPEPGRRFFSSGAFTHNHLK